MLLHALSIEWCTTANCAALYYENAAASNEHILSRTLPDIYLHIDMTLFSIIKY